MQAGVEFLLQGQHDCALDLYARQAFEGGGDDSHTVMRLALRAGTRMAGMFGAVIADFQLHRLKSFSQKVVNPR